MKTMLKIVSKIAMICLAIFGAIIAIIILLPAPAPFILSSYLNDHGYDNDNDDDDFNDEDILL